MEYPCITLVKTLALDTINEKILVITKRVQYRNWVEKKIENVSKYLHICAIQK